MQKSIVLFKFLFLVYSSTRLLRGRVCRAWAKPFAAEGGPPLGGEAAALAILLSPTLCIFQKVFNLDQQKFQTPMPENKIKECENCVLLYTATLIIMSTSEFVIEVYIMPEKFICWFPLSLLSKHFLIIARVMHFVRSPSPWEAIPVRCFSCHPMQWVSVVIRTSPLQAKPFKIKEMMGTCWGT